MFIFCPPLFTTVSNAQKYYQLNIRRLRPDNYLFPTRRCGAHLRMRHFCRPLLILAAVLFGTGVASAAPRHGIAMHGEVREAPDFTHFAYVNPQAPKGGALLLGERGSYDNLNPFTVRGLLPFGIREWIFESLLKRSNDEPFSLYAWLAESVEMADDRSWVTFRLDPRARFSDGAPVTVEDVIFSAQILRDKGRPNHRAYYAKILRITRPGPGQVRFEFDPNAIDREMPLIIGLMPVLPQAYYAEQDIAAPGLRPPRGSGPYIVSEVTPGRSISYLRNRDYWGADLPVNRGQNNFDTIRVDFYRDENTAFEAFKTGRFDLWEELDPARWARGYDFTAMQNGEVVRRAIAHGRPSGLNGFVFNTRRALFADIRVRQALGFLFDFEWVNRNYLHGAYRRTRSLFDNTWLASAGRAASQQEIRLLAPFTGVVPAEILRNGYTPPTSDGTGHNRDGLRRALALLREAGYELVNGRMTGRDGGAPLSFEILLVRPEEEKLALVLARSAERLGVKIYVRTVDASQYEERLRNFDFDMILYDWYASLSPGNEQKYYWGSAAAATPGSRNYPGVNSPAMDAMIAHLLAARGETDFVNAVRAMDRVLMAGHYVIPLYYLPANHLAWRRHVRMPERAPLYGFDISTWWDGRIE